VTLGTVHKRRPQSGGDGVCPVRTIFEHVKSVLRCGRLQKSKIFRKLWCVQHGQGEALANTNRVKGNEFALAGGMGVGRGAVAPPGFLNMVQI